MNSKNALALATMVTTTAATGCYSSWDITPQMLVRLDGFKEGQKQELRIRSVDRELITFTRDTELHLRGNDGVEVSARFSSIRIEEPIFTGTAIREDGGGQINADLNRLSSAEVRKFSPGKTALAATGIVAASGVVGYGIFVFIALASFSGGRPLRVAGEGAPLRAALGVDGARRRRARPARARGLDEATRARLFAHWAEEASSECASIPAFMALARDLKLASAPDTLVQAALRAAKEEAVHTELCAALASDHASAPITALTPPTPRNTDANPEELLKRLALEAFWDGCVAEGSAAAFARRSAAQARDHATRDALAVIARDEQSHAELSRDIFTFCLSKGGRALRNTLIERIEQRRDAEEARIERECEAGHEGNVDEDAAREYGMASAAATRAARVEAWEESLGLIAAAR